MGTAVPKGLLIDACFVFTHRTKIEKEKKEHAKLHGMIRTEISGAEIAEEMEKERRFFQLQMCEVRRCGRKATLYRPSRVRARPSPPRPVALVTAPAWVLGCVSVLKVCFARRMLDYLLVCGFRSV